MNQDGQPHQDRYGDGSGNHGNSSVRVDVYQATGESAFIQVNASA
jgi:hypothetical protein